VNYSIDTRACPLCNSHSKQQNISVKMSYKGNMTHEHMRKLNTPFIQILQNQQWHMNKIWYLLKQQNMVFTQAPKQQNTTAENYKRGK